MKTTNKFLALALVAVTIVFASCSKDDNEPVGPTQQEIEAKIVGKWKCTERDGKEVITNKRTVLTFANQGKGEASMSREINKVWVWANQEPISYQVNLNHLTLTIDKNVLPFAINSIDEKGFSYTSEGERIKGNPEFRSYYKSVTADYSQDIIGMWEGVEMTGYETYGNAEARIAYHADGTYTYYNNVDGYWVPSSNVDNEYNVDGDWLASRWRPEAGADYNYEWWDIDYIKDGMMKWSALREKEDGTRFTTTFTWKKVDDSASAQNIKANIVGSWQIDHVVRYEITDGNVIHKDIIPYDFMVSTISYTSDLTFSTYDYFVDSEQPDAKIDETRAQGRYSVADRQITHTFDDEPSKMYSNMVYSIDSQTMVIINHYIEGKTEFFSLTYYRKL